MELLCEFIEGRLELAVKYRNNRAIVSGFKHDAHGAAVYASLRAITEGNHELSREINNEWDNKYRIHFEALEKEAS